MKRLLLVLFLLFSMKGDAVVCDWEGIEKDSQGCVDFGIFKEAAKIGCSPLPCFKLQIEEEKIKREFFSKEDTEEKKKIIPMLDSSAIALLKNSSLKNIKIVFYNKSGKLSRGFQKEAEEYLLEKGVKREQFIIEIK